MSTKDFQFNGVTFYPYQFGSDPTRLHETFLGSDPNGITFESDPVWVRIADPNVFGSVESSVNARPIRYSLGTQAFSFDACDRTRTRWHTRRFMYECVLSHAQNDLLVR